MGNICRSPAAEIIFRKLVIDAGRGGDFVVDSAGTIGFHEGRAPDPRMTVTLKRRGYHADGSARQVQPEDLDRYDLVVPMDMENTQDLLDLAMTPEHREKIRPLVGFCSRHESDCVPDPYHGGQQGFDHVVELLEDGCEGILRYFAG